MHREVLRKLYHQATDECIELARNDAWLWEEKFAEAVEKQTVKDIAKYLRESDMEEGSIGRKVYDNLAKILELKYGI